MTSKFYLRGHEIEWNGYGWVYSDTKEPTARKQETRPCGKCGEFATPEGHDDCLGTLPGVMNACCGHGHDEAYAQFENGMIIRGRFDE